MYQKSSSYWKQLRTNIMILVQFFSIFLLLFTITQSGDIIDKQISGLWYSYENLL